MYLCEKVDSSGVIHPWSQDKQQVVQHHWLVVQVELDGLVVQLNVGYFGDDVLEVGLSPRLGGVTHHG